MKRAVLLQEEYAQVKMIENLTSVFESISSMHIARVKDQVVSSTAFFHELWDIYSQLRKTEEAFRPTRPTKSQPALIIITSETGGLVGDIDNRIITAAAEKIKPGIDVFAVGSHGAALLADQRIHPKKVFSLPQGEQAVNVAAIAQLAAEYPDVTVYYQTYVSLARQEVASLNLFSAVSALASSHDTRDRQSITGSGYTFEPSVKDLVTYLQSVMVEIALGQVILESKLAQYASRFNAMYAAKSRAGTQREEVRRDLGRARRAEGDERLREIFGAIRAGGR